MEISGEHSLPRPPDAVWMALHSVSTLRACVPGCEELDQTSSDTYTGAASVGIGVIKGLYRGTLTLLEEVEPSFVRVVVQARSGHAEIKGEGRLSLEASDGGTLARYDAEARISGPLAAVGQRLLPSASKSLADQFFANLRAALSAPEPSKS